MLPSGIQPSANALRGYKDADGMYVFPNVYEDTYDYFADTQKLVSDERALEIAAEIKQRFAELTDRN
jgi:hypothetical protein